MASPVQLAGLIANTQGAFGENVQTPILVDPHTLSSTGFSTNLPMTGTAGAPTSGTWAYGQLAIDSQNRIWVCTAAGTPGSWQLVGSGTYAVLPLFGQLLFVDPVNGSDSNAGTSWGTAFKTITAANAALPLGGGGRPVGTLMLAPGIHQIGTVNSSATGFNQASGVRVIGSGSNGYAASGALPTIVQYLGTGIGWQTGATSSSIWSGGYLSSLSIIGSNSAATTLLNVNNAQNNSCIDDVWVGDSAFSANNPTTSACTVTSNLSPTESYPGFLTFGRCWFVGGTVPVDVMMGTTFVDFVECGIDPLSDATIGLRVNSGGSADYKSRFRFRGKMELHNGISAAPAATLNSDSTAAQVTAGAHYYGITMVTAGGESGMSLVSNTVTNDVSHTSNTVTLPLVANGANAQRVTARKLYRTTAGGSTLELLTTINDNTTASYQDTTPDASLGAAYSQPAAGTAGNPFAFQVNTVAPFEIDAETYADAVCTGQAVDYEASPTGPTWPRGWFRLNWLNFPFAFKGPHTNLVNVTIPNSSLAQGTLGYQFVQFLGSLYVTDVVGAAKSLSSVTPTGLGTGGAAAVSGDVFAANERRGQLTITVGSSGVAANPSVQCVFQTNVPINGNAVVLLTAATKSDGTASPSDWTNWQVSYNSTGGTTQGRFTLLWTGASAPTTNNVYYLNYMVVG